MSATKKSRKKKAKKPFLVQWQRAEKLIVALGGEVDASILMRAAYQTKWEINIERAEYLLRQLTRLGLIIATQKGFYKQNIHPLLLKRPTMILDERDF